MINPTHLALNQEGNRVHTQKSIVIMTAEACWPSANERVEGRKVGAALGYQKFHCVVLVSLMKLRE